MLSSLAHPAFLPSLWYIACQLIFCRLFPYGLILNRGSLISEEEKKKKVSHEPSISMFIKKEGVLLMYNNSQQMLTLRWVAERSTCSRTSHMVWIYRNSLSAVFHYSSNTYSWISVTHRRSQYLWAAKVSVRTCWKMSDFDLQWWKTLTQTVGCGTTMTEWENGLILVERRGIVHNVNY